MLNSILERNPRKITLDQIKTIIDDNITFTMDPLEIEHIASTHYQKVGTLHPAINKYNPNLPLRQS